MSGPAPRGVIAVLAKSPVPGLVKTRLIPEFGANAACALAAAGLLDTWAMATQINRADTELWLDGDARRLPPLTPCPVPLAQPAGDLGARLSEAFQAALLAVGRPWVVALGTDSPGLPARVVNEAIDWLAQREPGASCGKSRRAVLGPSDDGGYYLLGLSAWIPGLLSNLPWSSAETLAATKGRLLEHGFAVHTTEPYFDLDEAADVYRLARLLRESAVSAPATHTLLSGWPGLMPPEST